MNQATRVLAFAVLASACVTAVPIWGDFAMASDQVIAWGLNSSGECTVPAPNAEFITVAGGGYHNLGLKANGTIVAWGSNSYGQCTVSSPNSGFTAVAAGLNHSLGLKINGSIVAWGSNLNGYFSNNYAGQCVVPSPNSNFVAVAAGDFHSLGLKADGSIVAWGWNDNGQCNVPSPNTGFVAVAAGYAHSIGLKSSGSIVAWGWNQDGQCTVPYPNLGFVAVASGGWHGLGLKTDGSIVAWGWNYFGQRTVPSPNTGFTAVAAGAEFSLGLKADGSIVAWGANWYGQCTVPTPNTGFAAVAAGNYHSLGLKSVSIPEQWPICADAPCLRFRVECYSAAGVPSTAIANVRLVTAIGSLGANLLSRPVVGGYAAFDNIALSGLVGPYTDTPIIRVDLLDAGDHKMGHIAFNYNQWDFSTEHKSIDAYLFVHEYDTPQSINGWDYYASDEHPVSMLLPPKESVGSAGGGTKKPVVLVHGVAGEYPYWDTVYYQDSIPWKVDSAQYDAWQFYYPYDQQIEPSAELLKQAIARIREGTLPGAPAYAGIPAPRVALVAHSMGGLVSRYLIQYSGGANTVAKLLMLGTPNHGSHAAYQLTYEDVPGWWGELKIGRNKEAPAYEEMAPASEFLFALNALAPAGLQTGTVARDYLVGAGVKDYGGLNGSGHSEIDDQEDGTVAVASASLVKYGIPLVLVREDHDGLHSASGAADLVNVFCADTYDPGSVTYPSWVQCTLPSVEEAQCIATQGVACGSIFELRLSGLQGEKKKTTDFGVYVDNSNAVIRLDRNGKRNGRTFMQRVGDTESFFSRVDDMPNNGWIPKEIRMGCGSGQYRMVIGDEICSDRECVSWWVESREAALSIVDYATTMASFELDQSVIDALNAPNARALKRLPSKTAEYEYFADSSTDTLIFSLTSGTEPGALQNSVMVLVDPVGNIIDSAWSATDPNIEYRDSVNGGPVQYVVTSPTEGAWRVRHSELLATPQVIAFLYGSYRAEMTPPSIDVVLGDTLTVNIGVVGGDICAGQSVSVNVLYASTDSTLVEDLGAIPVVQDSPGAYRASLVPDHAGRYSFELVANCDRILGGAIERRSFQSVWVASGNSLTGVDQGDGPHPGGDIDLPGAFRVSGCWPNPFNPLTTVEYEIPRAQAVRISIYDIRGRLVRRLLDNVAQSAGRHEIAWNGRADSGAAQPSGVYFCRLEAGGHAQTIKLALLK
jgi:hypothetical protein